MRMCNKRVLSVIMTFALIFGCFAGTGITADAGIFKADISSEELESSGGSVTVTVTGQDLDGAVWWVLEKKASGQEGDGTYETIGEKVNVAEVDTAQEKAEFSVEIPENTGDADEAYRIRVSRTDPYDPVSGEYTWEGESKEVIVTAKETEVFKKDTVSGDVVGGTQPEQEEESADKTQIVMEDAVETDIVKDTLETVPEGMVPQDTKVPVYHTIPAYQQKDLYAAPTVKISGLPVEEIVDGKANGETQPYTEPIRFKIFNSTKQEVEKIVEAKDGKLPDLNLANNQNYIISSLDDKYKVVRYDGNAQNKLTLNAYIWVNNGQILNIKEGAEYPYNYPVFSKIQITKRATGESKEDDRVPMYFYVYYKKIGGGMLFNVKLKLVSEFETLEADTGNTGRINVSVLEDVNYIVTVDDPKYDIEAFPVAAKDKSEYRTATDRPGERYFYDHSTCHQVEALCLVDKGEAHINDKTVTSLSGNTTVSGFNFNDFLVIEKNLSKSLVTGLNGKDYDVLSISTVNPHRWEISKLATGSFNITEKIDASKKVDYVYYIDKEGQLQPLSFNQTGNIVSFTMNSMSIHPVVFVYNSVPRRIVQSITVSGISKNIASGKKIRLTANITPSNAENKAVTWTSSNNNYAVVDSNGNVTAKKTGIGKTVKITATAKDGTGKQGVYQIKIMKDAVKSISLKAAKTVKAGKKLKVKATVKTTGKSANKKLIWTSSNTKYATVNSSGKVTAKKAGKGKKVKITAQATDGSGKKKTVTIKIK